MALQFPDKFKIAHRKKYAHAAIFFLIVFSPFFFQKWKLKLSLPHAVSGDEPHYLVTASSIAKDGDLDVRNNYENRDYGEKLSKFNLDHHTYFIDENHNVIPWEDAFIQSRDEDGSVVFRKKDEYRDVNLEKFHEISIHPPGYPVILSLLFYPLLRYGVLHTESIIIFFQLFFFFLTVLYAARTFAVKNIPVFLICSLSYPVWTLNASLYTEGFIGSLLLLALCHLERKNALLFSLDLFLVVFIKEIYFPAAFFFIILFFLENKFKAGHISAVILPLVALFMYLIRNFLIFSDPLRTYVPYVLNSDIPGSALEFLSSPYKGILVFSPHLLFLPAAFMRQIRANPGRGTVLLIMTCTVIALTVFHRSWSGGPSFSYRTVAPILFFTFPMLYIFIFDKSLNNITGYSFLLLILVSFINIFYSVTNLESSYASHPFLNPINPLDSRLAERLSGK